MIDYADLPAIEEGVPMPPVRRGRPSPYPWDDMDVGESFVATTESVYQAVSRANARHTSSGKRWTTRKEGENTWRVWRIQ